MCRIIQETEDVELLKLAHSSNKEVEKWKEREGHPNYYMKQDF
jgi:hypothetical protein